MQYIALHCYDKIIGSKTLREYLFIFNIDEDYLNMTKIGCLKIMLLIRNEFHAKFRQYINY